MSFYFEYFFMCIEKSSKKNERTTFSINVRLKYSLNNCDFIRIQKKKKRKKEENGEKTKQSSLLL